MDSVRVATNDCLIDNRHRVLPQKLKDIAYSCVSVNLRRSCALWLVGMLVRAHTQKIREIQTLNFRYHLIVEWRWLGSGADLWHTP